jgi:hypothetical protein
MLDRRFVGSMSAKKWLEHSTVLSSTKHDTNRRAPRMCEVRGMMIVEPRDLQPNSGRHTTRLDLEISRLKRLTSASELPVLGKTPGRQASPLACGVTRCPEHWTPRAERSGNQTLADQATDYNVRRLDVFWCRPSANSSVLSAGMT